MQKHIPNTVTLLGAFCGMLATSFAFEQRLDWAAYFILIAAFCDFVDGFLARLLNAKSALGADLDSLADVVSFSVAPASIAYHLLLESLPVNLSWLAYVAFLIVPLSALRLAIFNNSTNQTTSFVGLPVPANAMLWVGLVFLSQMPSKWQPLLDILLSPWALLAYVVVFSLLLVSKLPLFALKFSKDNPIHKNKWLWIFLIIVLSLLFFFHLGGFFFIVCVYVLSGILKKLRFF